MHHITEIKYANAITGWLYVYIHIIKFEMLCNIPSKTVIKYIYFLIISVHAILWLIFIENNILGFLKIHIFV